ncbi:hypothetical protein ACFLSQ_05970 [Bacteroidota bacterium]
MKFLLSFIIIIFIANSIVFLHARIITVDKKSPSQGDYTSLRSAFDAASDGDTIYVYPNEIAYNIGVEPSWSDTIRKKLTIIGSGCGYPNQNLITSKLGGYLNFDTGSEGSKIIGFDGSFSISIGADSIFVARNYLFKLYVKPYHSNTSIIQNIFNNTQWPVISIEIDRNNDVLIANNIISNINRLGIWTNEDDITISLINNILKCDIDLNLTNKTVINNIIISGTYNGTDTGLTYNMCDGTQLPEGTGNIRNVDMNTVFIDPDNLDFHLKPNSPARGTGKDGVDMGIYGGSTPFVDGGYPGIPSIIELDADHLGSKQSGIKVKIKAKSNKD